jgi:hypothetical protein
VKAGQGTVRSSAHFTHESTPADWVAVVVVVVMALKKLTQRKVRVALFFVKPGCGDCLAAVQRARRPS